MASRTTLSVGAPRPTGRKYHWRGGAAARFLAGLAVAGAASLLIGHSAQAQGAETWTTGTGTANWSAAGNWTGTNTPPISGDSLTFDATTGPTTLNNNLTGSAAFSIAGITYTAAAPAYTISGNDFTLAGRITNNGTLVQTINDNIALTAQQTLNGNMTLGGVISGAGSLIYGDVAASAALFTVSGNNTYSGGTIIENSPNSGSTPAVLATSNNAFGTGLISISPSGNATNAKMEVGNGVTIANAINFAGRTTGITTPGIESVGGANTISSAITLIPGGSMYTIQSDAGSTLALPGGVTVGGGAGTGTIRNLTFTGAGNGSETGAITNGSSLVAITKTGTGTWTLSGADAYTNGTTITAGKLAVANNSALGTGAVTMNGGTLATGANGLTVTAGAVTITASSVLDFGAGNTGDIFKFANSSVNPFTGTLSVYDWKGSATGGGPDQLFFGIDATGLTAAQVSQITFYSDAGTTALSNVHILSSGEVVATPAAAPEPSQFAAFGLGILGLAGMTLKARKRSETVSA